MRDFSSLEPGKELDALVAEVVMGWKNIRFLPGGNTPMGEPDDDYNRDYPNNRHSTWILDYSTNLEIAWCVVEKLKERNEIRAVTINNYRNTDDFNCYWVSFQTYDEDDISDGSGYASKSLAHSICVAALEATEFFNSHQQ